MRIEPITLRIPRKPIPFLGKLNQLKSITKYNSYNYSNYFKFPKYDNGEVYKHF